MTTPPASQFLSTVALLRAGKITVDEARARNRAQREALGEAEYDRAKREAIVVDARHYGA
jgi:hypothetical protein